MSDINHNLVLPNALPLPQKKKKKKFTTLAKSMQNLYDPCYKTPKARISFPFQHQQSSDGNLIYKDLHRERG